jgi:hypothetical protein
MTTTDERRHQRERADLARQAAAAMHEDRPLNPVETAAKEALERKAWVLWHAEDYSEGVIRLLHSAGMLRDRDAEKRQAEADASTHRLMRLDLAEHQARYPVLVNAITQTVHALREGRDPVELADALEKALRRAERKGREARRGKEADE